MHLAPKNLALLIGSLLLTLLVAFPAGAESADWTISLNVKLALLDKLGGDSLHIEVDTKNGRAVLTGTVNKRATAELAETIARSVKGVREVDNHVRVDPGEQSKAGAAVAEAEAELRDAILETKVDLVLVDQLGSDGFRIGTEVANGVLTLAFDKSMTKSRRRQAVSIAKKIDGIRKVIAIDRK